MVLSCFQSQVNLPWRGPLHDLIEVAGTVETLEELVSREDTLIILRHHEDIGEDRHVCITASMDGESTEQGEIWWSCDTETEGVLHCH